MAAYEYGLLLIKVKTLCFDFLKYINNKRSDLQI